MRNKITKDYFKGYYDDHNHIMNLSVIGKEFDITRQRVHQIFSEFKKADPVFAAYFDKTIPKEELAVLLKQNKTIKEIAKHFDVTISIIKSRMIKYDLDRIYYKTLLTESVLQDMFIDENMTDKQIAERMHCSVHTIKQCRYQHDIYKEGGKRK